jgi:hypothetical protein
MAIHDLMYVAVVVRVWGTSCLSPGCVSPGCEIVDGVRLESIPKEKLSGGQVHSPPLYP